MIKWYIENRTNGKKYYYNGYLEAVNDYHNLAKKLKVYPCSLIIGYEKNKNI